MKIEMFSLVVTSFLAVFILSACGGGSADGFCGTSAKILSETIDYDGDGVIDDTITNEYDLNGNQTVSSHDHDGDGEADSVDIFTYNSDGLLEEIIYNNDGDYRIIITYTYDSNGNAVTEFWEHPDDDNMTYIDASNGILISNTNDILTTNSYDSNNLLQTSTTNYSYFGDITTQFTYDENGNVIRMEIDNSNDGTIDRIIIITYTFDRNGNILTENVDADDDGTLDSITTYTYDSNGHKLSESIDFEVDGVNDRIYTFTWGCI